MDLTAYPQARIFATHGVEFSGMRGVELYGHCPFTDKPDKFYVNSKTWLWDSKTAGMSGNIASFLDEIQKDYIDALDDDQLQALVKSRGLPAGAFRGWKMGWTGDRYTIPVRDISGKMVDIRLYRLDKKQMRSTSGCHVGLLGAHLLPKSPAAPVYLCEGEWDAIALQWLFTQLKEPGIVLAVPGAGTFKNEWAPWLNGRRVTVLFDHDEAGRKGERIVAARLTSGTKHLSFVHWPTTLPDGFDTRDWIRYGIKKGTLALCWERLKALCQKGVRALTDGVKNVAGRTIRLIGAPVAERPKTLPTLADVHAVYRKWLHLPNTDAIDIMLAVALSQEIDGPPIWMFLVGPPGTAKTATLIGLSDYDKTYSTSSLTAHSLISGANFQGQGDPSLIPKLDGKVLVIKDFTSILGMRDSDKEEIFSILRDAYDGRCGKVFGNGVERSYESRFTVVAAVTPSIYDLGQRHSALGERFLKYVMADNLHHEQEEDIISRAIENVDRDTRMRDELSNVTGTFLGYSFESLTPAWLGNEIHRQIIALAQLGARLRGTVSRELYDTNMMTGRPFAEIGSRLGIQLSKMARALAMVRGKPEVTAEEFRLVKKVMIDTVSQRSEDIVRCLYLQSLVKDSGPFTTQDISRVTRYPMTTIRRVLDDLNLLKVINRRGLPGSGFKHVWTLSPYIMRCISESNVYSEPVIPRMRLRRKSRTVEFTPPGSRQGHAAGPNRAGGQTRPRVAP